MYLELGEIVGVWGVKGWVKLHSYTRPRADIANYSNWWLQSDNKSSRFSSPQAVEILNCREQGQGVAAQIKGVNDRDTAATYKGLRILIKKTDLPELSAGEYYWQDLIGLNVSTVEQLDIGIIESILETGANDVLVIKINDDEDVLIPNIPEVVKNVDLKLGTMIVDWDPSYLLD